jgi:hypothetical protein
VSRIKDIIFTLASLVVGRTNSFATAGGVAIVGVVVVAVAFPYCSLRPTTVLWTRKITKSHFPQ